jgi:hypothetical protein
VQIVLIGWIYWFAVRPSQIHLHETFNPATQNRTQKQCHSTSKAHREKDNGSQWSGFIVTGTGIMAKVWSHALP